MNTKTVKIKEIMDSPPTNSGLKKSHVVQEVSKKEDYVPVYSASQNENLVFGWVKKESKWKKYSNVLTWNKDGSSGLVFYRKDLFVPYEKVKLLKIKNIFEKVLYYPFLKIIIQNKLLSEGFNFGFKCSMERVLEIEIEIPINSKKEFDYSKQKELAKKYEKINHLKGNLNIMLNEISESKISLDNKYKTKEIFISDIFDIQKGSAKYTKEYMRNHQGNFPLYSSQTIKDGIIGLIDTFDFNTKCLTWTTDGIHAGTVFFRDGKFSITTHCGALFLKQKFKDLIDLKYIQYQLALYLKDYATGEGNKRVTVKIMEKVPIKIIIDSKGHFDINKQIEIAKKYFEIQRIKNSIINEFEEMTSSNVSIVA